MQPKQDRSKRTREFILLAAAQQFDEHGFRGTSIADIAKRANLLKGHINYHFSTKAQLAQAVVAEVFDDGTFLHSPEAKRSEGLSTLIADSISVAIGSTENVFARAALRLLDERNSIDAVLPIPYLGWVDKVSEHLTVAIQLNELPGGFDVHDQAWLMVAASHGVKHVAFQTGNLENLLRLSNAMLKSQLLALGAADLDRYFAQSTI